MLKKSHLSFLFLLSFLLLQCTRDFSVQPIEGQVRQLTPLEKQVVESDNAFGLKLFKELIKAEPDKNVFISPLSVAMALGMTYNGAAGSTEEAMRNTLEFGNMSFQEINESFQSLIELLTQLDPKVRFQIANSIWYRLGFQVEQDFIDLNKKYFGAEVRSLDFSSPSSVDIINNWVDEKTNSKIDKIIDNIDPMTMMFLINAIYFKGMWTYEFDKNMTSDEQFTKPDGSQVPCKMMKMTADLNYFADETVQIVDLPYGDGQFSMTVILPRSDQSIDAVAADLTPSQWTEWLSKLTKASGTVELPKFKLEYEKKLNDALTALGMGIAFSGQADFTRIDRKGGLYISKVKHKTFVEVDEEGTEAAAVTVVDIRLTSVGPSVEFYLRVDRPFIFAIRENHSQTILFIGKIVEPKL